MQTAATFVIPVRRGLVAGMLAGGISVAIVLVSVVIPIVAVSYPLALLPLLCAGPLVVSRIPSRMIDTALAGIVSGLTAGALASGTFAAATNLWGQSKWVLTGAASAAPMPTLPQPDLIGWMNWAQEDVLFGTPIIALVTALIYASFSSGIGAPVAAAVHRAIATRRLSVLSKLRISFLCFASLTILVAWVAFTALEDSHLRGHRLQMYGDWLGHIESLGDISEAMAVATVNPDTDTARTELLGLRAQRQSIIEHMRTAPRHSNLSIAPAAMLEVAMAWRPYLEEIDAAMSEYEDRVIQSIGAGSDVVLEVERLRAAHRVDSALQALDDETNGALRAGMDSIDFQHHGNLVGVMVLLALSLGLAWTISRAVSNVVIGPVQAIGRHLQRLAQGDFSSQVRVENRDELGLLATQLNHVSGELGRLYDIERQAREGSERRYRQLFEGVDDAILVADEHVVILDVNDAAATLFSRPRDTMIGSDATDLVTLPSGLPLHGSSLSSWNGPLRVVRPDSAEITAESRVSTMTVSDVTVSVAILRDITDRLRADEALRESNERLELALADLQAAQGRVIQQERLRALGQMASGIAHDFNNALSPIVGFSELLLVRRALWNDEATMHEYLTMINTAARDASSVVGRLREFYRPSSGSDCDESIDLDHLVREVVSLTQPKWKDESLAHGARLKVICDLDAQGSVRGSASELREALTNLIFNAVDAMPQGGQVTVRTRTLHTEVLVEVSDTGAGMTEEVRQRCFEPFFTTKGERGTGLGLGMVYGVVQRLSGAVDVSSQPGMGTTVSIRLPRDRRGSRPSLPAITVAPARERLRLLVVEDDVAIRRLIADTLAGEGHYVVTAYDGRDALRELDRDHFDIVLTDLAMPDLSGDQLALEIKRRNERQPVILISGFGEMIEITGEHPDGVDLVLSKPVATEQLLSALVQVRGTVRSA